MKITRYKAYSIMMAALMAASCSDIQEETVTNDAVAISTTLDGTPAHTRTATYPVYAPVGGTLTLVYGIPTGTQSSNYTCAADGRWSTAAPLYWNDLAPAASATQKYPFFAFAPAMPAAAPAVATNQATTANYVKSDLLMAYTTTAQRRTDVAFTLRHLLTQLTVSIVSSTDGDLDYLNPAYASLSLDGLRAAYTLSYDAPTPEVPATATATGDPANAYTPNKADGKHYLVLPPQTLASGALTITVSINGSNYTWHNAQALTLAAAQNNTITLTVKKTGLSLAASGIQIAPWDNSPAPISGTPTNADPDIKLPGTALNYLTEAGNIELAAYKGSEIVAGYGINYPVSYDPAQSEGKRAAIDTAHPDYRPMLWERLTKYTDDAATTLQDYTYTALFTPTATPALNHERAYLGGISAATPWGTAPSFSADDQRMKQLMSRLVVKLSFGTEFADADRAGISLSVTRKEKVGHINIKDATSFDVATTGVTAAEANVSLTPDATDPMSFHAILCPQGLAAAGDKYITLTLTSDTDVERVYTLKAKADFTLAGGQEHTLTLNVSKTALTMGNLEIAPWNETKGNGNLDWE